jgi:predicted nucleotidyltransferase
MRLTETEKQALLQAILRADASAEIYLFGSRAQAHLKGGDIDLLVVSAKIVFADKLGILAEIKDRLGEQKIDIKVVSPLALAQDAFAQSVLPGAIRLG